MNTRSIAAFVVGLTFVVAPAFSQGSGGETEMAIVGGTVIDGNGGAPMKDATVLIVGKRIKQIGPRDSVKVSKGATVIDATGKFLTPGFIDTNVHMSPYGGGTKDRKETSVLYWNQMDALTLESAQMELKYGVTTVRDSYGVLPPLVKIRDEIAHGSAIGSRMLVAGNIVGWGGPYSIGFGNFDHDLSLYEEKFTDEVAQGAGEDMLDMYPEELRVAINKYLDKGPNFIKYGGTTHFSQPTFIGFSPDAQKIIVDETHKRGLSAETHATSPEGLRIAINAGIDLIQHPEMLDGREMSDSMIQQIHDRKIIGSMLVSSMTGELWTKHLEDKEAAKKKIERRDAELAKPWGIRRASPRTLTTTERKRDEVALGTDLDMRRLNAQKLIKAGCLLTVGTDSYGGVDPDYQRAPKPLAQEPGIGTLIAIEGLVELGMTPSQAIVAGTKNGAIASKDLADFGTLTAGKFADIVILDADPLADIHNIQKQNAVVKEGRQIDLGSLPTHPVMYVR